MKREFGGGRFNLRDGWATKVNSGEVTKKVRQYLYIIFDDERRIKKKKK